MNRLIYRHAVSIHLRNKYNQVQVGMLVITSQFAQTPSHTPDT